VFDAADGGASVLLFDEADALFGVRGDVKDAQDRFANQEVSYLLQRLEGFQGCVILTTNLQNNIDAAFLRRFDAVVELASPTAPMRRALWRRALPETAPLEPDVDIDALASQFQLTGAQIAQAGLHARIHACAEARGVGMADLVEAVARETVKVGRQITQLEFGGWYDAVRHVA
jgi:SpoVK/Ycf46/Vps4 family AAA+-type ATPase